jgi:hypothetical protein
MASNVLFLHIPKSGGSTLLNLFQANYSSRDLLVMYDARYNQPFKFKYQFSEIRPRARYHTRCIVGHFSYGIDRYIAGEGYSRDWKYVSVLRNPLDRVFSDYLHLRRVNRWPECRHIRKMSFSDFLTSGIWPDANNGQVRRLCGLETECCTIGYGEVNRSHLQLAYHNIANDFLFVGTLNEFDYSIFRIGKALSWNQLRYAKSNRKPRSQVDIELTEQERQLALTYNNLDMELFQDIDGQVKKEISNDSEYQYSLKRFSTEKRSERAAYWAKNRYRRYRRAILKRLRNSLVPY